MQEIWKDVLGYEGKYQVSNLGRVKSLYREYILRCSLIKVKERILKAQINNMGYEYVGLSQGRGRVKLTLVHRIVATAFCDNPNKHKLVNHKDQNCRNNASENLEWCTQSHNIKEAYRLGIKPLSGAAHPRSKGCINTETGETTETIKALAVILGFSENHVLKMMRGEKRNRTSWVKINP